MTPGVASICLGSVHHERHTPRHHEFSQRVSMVWIDPDHPNDLCRHSRLWSTEGPSPLRFRRSDYGDDRTSPLGLLVRDDLAPVLGYRVGGPIRMLTQFRRLGWLFNPITVFLAWDVGPEPVGAVLEVTNTPWKERHRYAVALEPAASDAGTQEARFPKVLHVSPFLDERYDYVLRVGAGDDVRIELDVVAPDGEVVVSTALLLDRRPASPESLRAALSPLTSTHRVSGGIHVQAARLAAKRVPFVSHPRHRRSSRVPA